MAGRKPKPTALKELEGNPGKRKLNTKETRISFPSIWRRGSTKAFGHTARRMVTWITKYGKKAGNVRKCTNIKEFHENN